MLKKWLRELFYVQHSDRRVMLALLVVMAIVMVAIFLVGGRTPTAEHTPLMAKADSTAARTATAGTTEAPPPYYRQERTTVAERFVFDPNTADSTQLLRLGLRPWQVRNIYKYRAAGGIYRTKADFAQLYGLTVKEYRELEPYIEIGSDYRPAATLVADKSNDSTTVADTLRYPVKLAQGETIDLATADTTALKTVPGIGSYFARRVVEYRRRLGGFVRIEQLDEIDDFPQEAKSFLTLEQPAIEKININTLSMNELKKHPYINFYQARAIADY